MKKANRKMVLLALAAFTLTPVAACYAQPSGSDGASGSAPSNEPGQTIIVRFSNIEPATGTLWISLCSEAEFPDLTKGRCRGSAKIPAKPGAYYIFQGIAAGTYAITAFHDENDNGALDFDDRGIPFEATGNSQNAMGFFGPPTFDQMKFRLLPLAGNPKTRQIAIKMNRVEVP